LIVASSNIAVIVTVAGLSHGIRIPGGDRASDRGSKASATQWGGRATHSVILHILIRGRHRQRSYVCYQPSQCCYCARKIWDKLVCEPVSAAWCNGNMLVLVIEVTLCQAWLVTGLCWVPVGK